MKYQKADAHIEAHVYDSIILFFRSLDHTCKKFVLFLHLLFDLFKSRGPFVGPYKEFQMMMKNLDENNAITAVLFVPAEVDLGCNQSQKVPMVDDWHFHFLLCFGDSSTEHSLALASFHIVPHSKLSCHWSWRKDIMISFLCKTR